MAHLSLPTRAGIRYPGFFGAASDFHLVLDLASASSEDLGGAGVTGATTGMAVEHSSTITNSFRTAETLVTTGSITVISATVTSATAAPTTAADSTGLRVFTEVRALTGRQECTPAGSAALITAEIPEAFPPAGSRALEAAPTGGVSMVGVVFLVGAAERLHRSIVCAVT